MNTEMERNTFSRSSLRNSLRKLTVVAVRRQTPVLGEVDVGIDALHLLESPEETVTPVIIKVTVAPLLPEVPKSGVVPRHEPSNIQPENLKCDESEADTEEDDAFPKVVLRRYPVRDDLLADVIYALLNLQPQTQEVPDSLEDHGENKSKGSEETFPGTDLKDVKRRRRRSLIDLRAGSKEIKRERRRSVVSLATYGASGIGTRSYNEAGASQEEILKLLREIFEVDDETLIEIERQVRQREAPKITVHVEIIEAKELKPKANVDTRNPFCLVHVAGSTETFRTRTLFSTLKPQWDSQFSTGINNPQDCKVTVDIWHEPQDTPGFQKHLQRVKDTINQNEKRNLLGSVTVPVGILNESGIDGWYPIIKVKDDENKGTSAAGLITEGGSTLAKHRGSLHLKITQSTVSQTTLPGRTGYDSLLSKLTIHHLGLLGSLGVGGRGGSLDRRSTIKSNWSHQSNGSSISSSSSLSSSPDDGEGPVHLNSPWKGNLSHVSTLVLNQYAAVTSVTPASQTLIQWKVASRVHNVDQSFLLDLVKQMKIYLVEGKYSEEELKELKTSLRLWVTGCEESIRSLHANYPSSSKLVSHHQLTNTLRCLNFLDYEPSYRLLQPYITDSSVTDVITDALTCHTKSWWEKSLQIRGRNSPSASEEQQLIGAAGVASECYGFLTDIQQFYGDIFAREMNVSHLRISYILLSEELSSRVRPLLIKLYDYSGPRQQSQSRMEIVEGKDALALELGTPIWHLFKNLEKIVRLGDKLPDEVLLQSGLRNYHQWFSGGVNRWEQRTIARAKYFLKEEVDKEEFNMGPDCRSSSASEASYIFRIIKSSWDKLAWPDHKEARVYRARVIENLCGLGTQYSRQVAGKLNGLLQQENNKEEFLSKQLCVGLNNINYLCLEVEKLLDLFEVDEHEDEENVTTVVQDASYTMRDAINDFLDSTTRKLRPVLSSAVTEACMMANEAPLLASVLDDGLATLKRHLDVVNFQWFLIRLWRVLIEVFRNIVDENSNRRTASFFEDVFKILERTWQFFTPGDQYSLNPQEARTIEYLGLLNTLENLKMPTEALIAKYYRERADEQDRIGNPAIVAKLYIRGFFTRTGKLTVEIIMAKDLALENIRNRKSRTPMIRHGSTTKPDTYVQLSLVPQVWFSNIGTHRTKVERKNEEPVYEDQFEFRVSHTDEGARSGHLLFTLKQHNLLQNDIVVGETVLPLDKLRCIDTSDVRSVSNMILNVTSVRGDDDCTALRALQVRTWDKQAVSFLKELKKKRKLTQL